MSKIVDNFELIEDEFLKFEDEDTFYQLQVIRRGKDHPNLPSANRTIKIYYIDRKGKLSDIKDEVIALCELFGARAYINLNPKSYEKCTLQCISDMAKRASDGDFKKIYKQWNSVVGFSKPKRKEDVRWIIDIDFPMIQKFDDEIRDELVRIWATTATKKKHSDYVTELKFVRDNIDEYIYGKVPTKGGYHLITRPFDLEMFSKTFEGKIDVHKNNPTLLYIPEIQKLEQGERF